MYERLQLYHIALFVLFIILLGRVRPFEFLKQLNVRIIFDCFIYSGNFLPKIMLQALFQGVFEMSNYGSKD